LKLVS